MGRFLEGRIDEHFPDETGEVPVFAERYAYLSEILFYTRRPVQVLAAPRYRRSQFDLWTIEEIDHFQGRDGLLVSTDREKELYTPYFERITELGKVESRRFGHLVRVFHVFKVEGIKAAEIKEALQKKGLDIDFVLGTETVIISDAALSYFKQATGVRFSPRRWEAAGAGRNGKDNFPLGGACNSYRVRVSWKDKK